METVDKCQVLARELEVVECWS